MKKTSQLLITVLFLTAGLMQFSISVTGSTRASAQVPTWNNGDYWEYNEVYITVEVGQMGTTTYNWNNRVKYTLAGTSTYDGHTCYNLTISGTFDATGEMVNKAGTYSGFRLIRKSDLAMVYEYRFEDGSGGGMDYYYHYFISYSPVEDYYSFPIEPDGLPDTWSIMTTKTVHKVGQVTGRPPVDKIKHATINMAAQCSGTEAKSVPAASNVECYKITASGGAQSDNRWYSVDYGTFINSDYTETYNNTDTKNGYEELFDTSLEVNHKPQVSLFSANPDTVANDDLETTVLKVKVIDGEGLASSDPVTIDISQLGGDASQVMYDDGSNGDASSSDDYYSIEITVATDTVPGEYYLDITASDKDGLVNNTVRGQLTVVLRNFPPEIEQTKATPAEAPNDDETEVLLTAEVTDQNSDNDKMLKEVTVDLKAIGGNEFTPMLDNGAEGDVSDGDDIYSVRTVIDIYTIPGTYQLSVRALDEADEEVFDDISLKVLTANHPPVLSNPQAELDTVPNDGTTENLLTVELDDLDEENSHTVTINLDELGGKKFQPMMDDGEDGDETAEDGTYSYLLVVPSYVDPDEYVAMITARDDGINPVDVYENITITVSAQLHAPSIDDVQLSSPTVPNDGETELTFYVDVSDEDDNLDSVYADLTPLGQSSQKGMLYDSGSETYTLTITVSEDIDEGDYQITIKAVDEDELEAETSVTVRVEEITVFNYIPVLTKLRATPSSVPNDGETEVVLSVTVTDENGIADIDRVSIDLGDLDEGNVKMTDDGSMDDEDRRKFTCTITVGSTVPEGDYELEITVTDGEITDDPNEVDGEYITLTVTQAATVDTSGDSGSEDSPGFIMVEALVIVAVVAILVSRKYRK